METVRILFKKARGFFLNLLFVIIAVGVFALTILIVSYYSANTVIENSKEYYKNNYIFAENCYVDQNEYNQSKSKTEDAIALEELSDSVAKCLSLYPENARSYITNNWSIVFTSSPPDFATQYTNGMSSRDYSAVTVPDIQTIFVYSYSEETFTYVLTHEFGHVLAYEYGSPDFSTEFLDLYSLFKNSYEEESSCSVPKYATSSPSEFFASTMQAYVTDPDWLWNEAPGVADYMEELLKEEAYGNEVEHFWVRTQGMIRNVE